MQNNSMRDYVLNISAGQEKRIVAQGNYFHVVEASGKIGISFDDGAKIYRSQAMGGSADYKEVIISSAINQTVTISLGYGFIQDARASISGAAFSATIENANSSPITGDVTIPAGTTVLVASPNANRKTVNIFAHEDNLENLRVGCNNSVGANNGGILSPGGNGELSTQTGVWVYNPGAADEKVCIIDLENI